MISKKNENKSFEKKIATNIQIFSKKRKPHHFPMNQWHQEPSPIAPAARCARSAPKRRARKKVTAAAAP